MKQCLVIIVIFYVNSYLFSQKLSNHSKELIRSLLNSPITNFYSGKSGYVTSNGVNIWYEQINSTKPNNKGTILIINGASSDAFSIPHLLIKKLLDSSYNVIRFDNRGLGNSDWVKNKKHYKYNLRDMANDAIHILDTLGTKKVHIIGTSMGAMITQEIAIAYPQRVLSATLFMTSGHIIDKTLPRISLKTKSKILGCKLRYGRLKSAEQCARYQLCLKQILLNTETDSINVSDIVTSSIKNLTTKKGYNKNVFLEHFKAEKLNGPRYQELKHIVTPTLIIHGLNDPLLSYKHSEKCASFIPNSKLILVPEMGHTLTDKNINQLMPNIFENLSSY